MHQNHHQDSQLLLDAESQGPSLVQPRLYLQQEEYLQHAEKEVMTVWKDPSQMLLETP